MPTNLVNTMPALRYDRGAHKRVDGFRINDFFGRRSCLQRPIVGRELEIARGPSVECTSHQGSQKR